MLDINDYNQILDVIPHQPPFRFVNELLYVDEHSARGTYYFGKNEYFYSGHFPENPITPSVILTETMAQAGALPLGIVNVALENPEQDFSLIKPIFTNVELKFMKPVYPETKVTVEAEKIYFRLKRMKTKVTLFDNEHEICSSGIICSTILTNKDIAI